MRYKDGKEGQKGNYSVIHFYIYSFLNINYVSTEPFQDMEEFVKQGNPNKNYPVPNSKLCVLTYTDNVSSAYIHVF